MNEAGCLMKSLSIKFTNEDFFIYGCMVTPKGAIVRQLTFQNIFSTENLLRA